MTESGRTILPASNGHTTADSGVGAFDVPDFGSAKYLHDVAGTPGESVGAGRAQPSPELSTVRARIIKVLTRVRVPVQEAEDIAQQVIAELARNPQLLARLPNDGRFGPVIWLAICRVRTARQTAERRRNRESTWSTFGSVQPDPEKLIILRDLLSLWAKLVERLPETQRSVVMACVVEGLSHAEAAERFGLPLGTIKSRLGRGLAKVKALIQAELSMEDQPW